VFYTLYIRYIPYLQGHKIKFVKSLLAVGEQLKIALSDFFAGVLDSPLKFMFTLRETDGQTDRQTTDINA